MTIPGSKYEDALLRTLWASRGGRGWWGLELPVGYPGAPAASRRNRRVDAVVLPEAESRISSYLADLPAFGVAVEGQEVELIEAKARLNVAVIGQLLCGLSMFTARYPAHGPIRLTALVGEATDAALRWFCATERIDVIQVAPTWLAAPDSDNDPQPSP